MPVGTIKRLVHISAQTEISAANIAPSHNYRGYGYIDGEEGEIYFDPDDLENYRFVDLEEGEQVEYQLEPNSGLRAASVRMFPSGQRRS